MLEFGLVTGLLGSVCPADLGNGLFGFLLIV